jgi:hypothetical protein
VTVGTRSVLDGPIEPERNSDRLTRQWWLWFPAAGHQTTPQTFGNNMKTKQENEWTKKWLDSVVDGSSTMSQRKTSSVEKHGGGINALKRKAKQRGVHLVRLEDDKGNDLIAASLKPFKVLS